MSKVLFQTIQFSIRAQFSSIWPLDRTLSGATIPCQRGPGSDGNEGVLSIPQSYSITGTLPSYCLVSYPGHSLVGWSYPSAEMQSVYSTAPADWARRWQLVAHVIQQQRSIRYKASVRLHLFKILGWVKSFAIF